MNIQRDRLLLYGVTDRSWLKGESLEEAVKAAIKGGVTMIQLREKHCSHEELTEAARRLKPVCMAEGVPLIINDDVQAALEADADGVHVGQEDMTAAEARRILGPEKIVGASAHNREEALEAVRQGADYLGCGAVFGSSTKKDASFLPLEELKKICAAVPVPVAAIGGISEENCRELTGTGIAGIAVISAVFGKEDKEAAAVRLRRLAEEITGGKEK